MKKYERYFGSLLICAGVLFYCSACRHEGQSTENSTAFSGAEALTTSNIGRSLSNGMPRAEVLAAFGNPALHTTDSRGRIADHYLVLPGSARGSWRSKLSGFQVQYVNERVVGWSPIYSDRTMNIGQKMPIPIEKHTPDAVLTFRVVGEDTSTEPLAQPLQDAEVVVRSLKSANELVSGKNGASLIFFEFCADDALAMKNFTKTNAGREMVILCDGKALARLTIFEEIADGKVQITASSQDILKELKEAAARCKSCGATP